MMIIDYSILLVSIVMVDYSGTFLFSFFLFFSFLLAVSRMCRVRCRSIEMQRIKLERNLVKTFGRLNGRYEDDFQCNLTRHSSLHGIFIPRQFQIRFLSEKGALPTLYFFIHINRSYVFQI